METMRAEYEHNLTQQIYVSSGVWDSIKLAKEEVIKIINIATVQVGSDATGSELSKKVFEILLSLESSPTQVAINQIKKEVSQYF